MTPASATRPTTADLRALLDACGKASVTVAVGSTGRDRRRLGAERGEYVPRGG